MTTTDRYNYRHFRARSYHFVDPAGPRAGQPMPDLVLTTLEGETRHLSDYRGRTLVIETGSVTCPMYAKGVPAMNRLAGRFPDVEFVVLYVREAHPGTRRGPHVDEEDKRTVAATVESAMGDRRTVLVDDLSGSAHRALGALPDMVYIVDPDGIVRFRGDWTDTEAVDAALAGKADDELLRTEHFPPAKPTPPLALRTLWRGGWDGVADFVASLPTLLLMHRRADRAAAARRAADERTGQPV